jgi:general secretion pathway protein G
VGFTLIELLTVILIIGVLMSLILGVGAFAHRKNLESKAWADIETIRTWLTDYKMDVGTYPPDATWTNALKDSGFAKEAFDFIDPWGNEYEYHYDSASPSTYVLFSKGADGEGGPTSPPESNADNLEAGRM